MKILVVDDDRLIRMALSAKLRNKGYEVLTASDGIQALEIIEKNKPQLIICDIVMPGISGLELMNLLKHFYFNHIPVIAISASDNTRLATLLSSYGITKFLPKPIQFNDLYNELRHASNNAGI